MSEKNLNSRNKSQTRKISIQRILKLMVLLNRGKASSHVVQAFAGDLVAKHPSVRDTDAWKIFQKEFPANPKLKEKKRSQDEITPEEAEEIKKNLESFNNPPEAQSSYRPPEVPEELKSLGKNPVENDIAKKLVEYKARAEDAENGVNEISKLAFEFKANALVERQENKLMLETLKKVISEKVEEAIEITVERVERGRELRKKQVLDSLKSK